MTRGRKPWMERTGTMEPSREEGNQGSREQRRWNSDKGKGTKDRENKHGGAMTRGRKPWMERTGTMESSREKGIGIERTRTIE
ncbi:hypothetical protein PoB_003709500 [Plakobranchus ocellatus]|uniref:Uncharacterized protein n=1 Tax=Plakobranchus ocellatus TaxID=259542 RepID=A0AAV4AUL4_9GAST|nr:hypothetical protein PoB_003709500 [Plakobranchus ocellatus]